MYDPTLSLNDNLQNLITEENLNESISKKVMNTPEYFYSHKSPNNNEYTNEDIFNAMRSLFDAYSGDLRDEFFDALKRKYDVCELLLDFIN